MLYEFDLPFNSLSDSDIAELNILASFPIHDGFSIDVLNNQSFKQFTSNDDDRVDNSDPDSFLQSQLNLVNPQCSYLIPADLSDYLLQFDESHFKITCHNWRAPDSSATIHNLPYGLNRFAKPDMASQNQRK